MASENGIDVSLKRITDPKIIDPLLAILRDPASDEDEKNMAASTLVEAIAPEIMQMAVDQLARAYLAQHEPDDDLPVDEDFLKSIGYSTKQGKCLFNDDDETTSFESSDRGFYFNFPMTFQPPTRRAVRQLLAALGLK